MSDTQIQSSNLSECTAQLGQGRPVLLIDDLAHQISGYLVAPAETISEDDVCLMVNEGRGVICAALPESRADELALPMMTAQSVRGTLDFTVSVEARVGVSTGISAADRANTLRTLAKTTDPRGDLVIPGHIFPVKAKAGGVLVRTSVAEAAVDLISICSVSPTAAFCHCLTEAGELPTKEQLDELANSKKLPQVGISDIISHQLAVEPIVQRIAEARLPTQFAGTFQAVCFTSNNDDAEHLALVKGDPQTWTADGHHPVLVRVQSEQRLCDLLGLDFSERRALIMGALRKIDEAGRGVFVYVRNPRRGFLQAQVQQVAFGRPASRAAQLREYGIGAQILSALGVSRASFLTNTGKVVPGVAAFGIEIAELVSFDLFKEPIDTADESLVNSIV